MIPQPTHMAGPSLSKIIDFVKKHPYGTAAGVFGVGVLFLLLRGGNSSSGNSSSGSAVATTDPNYATDVAAATQLQLAQQQSATQQNATNAAASVANGQTAASVSIAQIQGQVSTTNTSVVADQNVSIATLQSQSQNLASTLTAQTQNNEIAALQNIALAPYEVQLAQINSTTPAAIANLQQQIAYVATNAANGINAANANAQPASSIYDPTTDASVHNLNNFASSLSHG